MSTSCGHSSASHLGPRPPTSVSVLFPFPSLPTHSVPSPVSYPSLSSFSLRFIHYLSTYQIQYPPAARAPVSLNPSRLIPIFVTPDQAHLLHLASLSFPSHSSVSKILIFCPRLVFLHSAPSVLPSHLHPSVIYPTVGIRHVHSSIFPVLSQCSSHLLSLPFFPPPIFLFSSHLCLPLLLPLSSTVFPLTIPLFLLQHPFFPFFLCYSSITIFASSSIIQLSLPIIACLSYFLSRPPSFLSPSRSSSSNIPSFLSSLVTSLTPSSHLPPSSVFASLSPLYRSLSSSILLSASYSPQSPFTFLRFTTSILPPCHYSSSSSFRPSSFPDSPISSLICSPPSMHSSVPHHPSFFPLLLKQLSYRPSPFPDSPTSSLICSPPSVFPQPCILQLPATATLDAYLRTASYRKQFTLPSSILSHSTPALGHHPASHCPQELASTFSPGNRQTLVH